MTSSERLHGEFILSASPTLRVPFCSPFLPAPLPSKTQIAMVAVK
ncbi:hypothetical protein RintRC_0932 [Richelia intracellularis]|nr:hypothetical protein RintRC_0932 [Richelia intracellularis]